jgi:hypothetical protein
MAVHSEELQTAEKLVPMVRRLSGEIMTIKKPSPPLRKSLVLTDEELKLRKLAKI